MTSALSFSLEYPNTHTYPYSVNHIPSEGRGSAKQDGRGKLSGPIELSSHRHTPQHAESFTDMLSLSGQRRRAWSALSVVSVGGGMQGRAHVPKTHDKIKKKKKRGIKQNRAALQVKTQPGSDKSQRNHQNRTMSCFHMAALSV